MHSPLCLLQTLTALQWWKCILQEEGEFVYADSQMLVRKHVIYCQPALHSLNNEGNINAFKSFLKGKNSNS